MASHKAEVPFGNGFMVFETGKIAKQADGAVVVRCGDTMVLVTACVAKTVREGIDWFPLTVEYQEKTYSAGRIPGGFFKREGRPTESEILGCRLIDRPIRPLFPDGFRNDVQVVAMVLSSDGAVDPDILALNGASLALGISPIPFAGPIGGIRVARVEGKFIVNPSYAEREAADIEVVVVSNKEKVIMIESEATGVSEKDVLATLHFAHEALQPLIQAQEAFIAKVGAPKMSFESKSVDPKVIDAVRALFGPRIKAACRITDREKRHEESRAVAQEASQKFCVENDEPFCGGDVAAAIDLIEQEEVRRMALDEKIRVDGRKIDEIRAITCEIGALPRTHGSALFTRGQTQSLAVTTLGTRTDEQLIEALEGKSYRKFMLHYAFPPFSVGETKPVRGPGRREIGHGALAAKSVKAVMPKPEEFPYTVRVVSEILESNGSSSMATVCASTLALMDAGVPIKAPVAGVALGLVTDKDRHVVLSDIAGIEDHHGDMDFKVAGTRTGVVAIQLDLKIPGIGFNIIEETLERARHGRMHVLDKMAAVIDKPRPEISAYAPRIITLKINPETIGALIGPGGKNIRKIIELTQVSIDVEDDGTVLVASSDAAATERALDMVRGLTEEPEVGKIYHGKVKKLMNFGCFVEILPGKEGLVHVSELEDKYVKNVEDVVKVGDEFDVKVVNIDDLGRVNLSRKQARPKQDKKA
ncbi:MAG: polyribonucleotide nucleotidyltransferase [Deltaproteobacteria bacterium]